MTLNRVQKFVSENDFYEYNIYVIENILTQHILECIVRNTPVLVNRIEGVIDYLGEDYPLYFDNLKEIDDLLDIRKIKEAHLYLKKMDKKKFKIEMFANKIFDLVNQHFR